MKKLLIISTFILAVLSCKKEAIRPQEVESSERISVSEVKKFLTHLKNEKKSNTGFNPASILNSINWNDIKQTSDSLILYGRFKGQPFDQYLTLGYRQAIFYKDSLDQITIKIMEVLPDLSHLTLYKKINPKHFSGKVFFYDSDYNLEGGLVYQDGKVGGAISKNIPKKQTSANTSVVVTQCHVETGAYFNAEHVLILFAYNVCTTYDFPGSSQIDEGDFIEDYTDEGSYGTGGGSYEPPVAEIVLPGSSDPEIENIRNRTNCFGTANNSSSSYSITVYIEEPQWGSSSYGPINGVGHTWIGITKDGVTQNIGFYPAGAPMSQLANQNVISTLRDNGSRTYTISSSSFTNLISALNSYNPSTYYYNLYSQNCSNFVYDMTSQAGINLPQSNAFGPTTRSPGQLTSDLRATGYNDLNTQGGTAPASHGACN